MGLKVMFWMAVTEERISAPAMLTGSYPGAVTWSVYSE